MFLFIKKRIFCYLLLMFLFFIFSAEWLKKKRYIRIHRQHTPGDVIVYPFFFRICKEKQIMRQFWWNPFFFLNEKISGIHVCFKLFFLKSLKENTHWRYTYFKIIGFELKLNSWEKIFTEKNLVTPHCFISLIWSKRKTYIPYILKRF